MNKRIRSRRAFSLVEILFAVIIIGVLTAVAIPSLFSQKGKADDSNAKQTLRTVQQLARTSQDDTGEFNWGSEADMATYLSKQEKDICFVLPSGTATKTGTCIGGATFSKNSRRVSVDSSATLFQISTFGADNNGTYTCWAMKIDSTGSTATQYFRFTNANCNTNNITGTAALGDFPTK